MHTMTYNQALKIQQEQIEYYHRAGDGPLTAAGVEKLKGMTKPCPFDPDELVPVRTINELVPRGGDIETIMGINQGGY